MKKTLMKVIISVGIGIGGVGLAVFAAILIAAPTRAGANPRYIAVATSTAPATTTVRTLTPGLSTTTMTYDAYLNTSDTIPSEARLLIIANASTSLIADSSLVLDYQIESSFNNIDFFGEDEIPTTFTAGQNVIQHSSSTPTHRWTIDTTNNATTTVLKEITIKPKLQYTRITFTNPAGAILQSDATNTRVALWARIEPIKEVSY